MSDSHEPSPDDPHTYYAAAFGIGVIAAGVMTLLTFVARQAGWTTFDLAMTLGTVSAFVGAPGPGVWIQGFLAVLVCGGIFALAYASVFEYLGSRGARAWRGVLTGDFWLLQTLGIIMTAYGVYVCYLMLRRPEELAVEENHVSWAHMYRMMFVAQIGFALAYLL